MNRVYFVVEEILKSNGKKKYSVRLEDALNLNLTTSPLR